MYLFMPGEPPAVVIRRVLGPTARTLFVAILLLTLIGLELLLWESGHWPGVLIGNLFLPVTASVAPFYEGLRSGTSGLLTCYVILLVLAPLLRIDRADEAPGS